MNQGLPVEMPEPEQRHLEDMAGGIEPAKASRVLFWAILGFFVIAIIWAALAEIDRTVRGMGRVISSSELQVVSSLEGGIIQDILVRPGDIVRAAQPLIRLDPTESGANLGSTAATASALGMKIARLSAEITGRAPRYPAPDDADAARQLQIERSLYSSRQATLRSLLAGGRAQVSRGNQAILEAQAVIAAAESARSAARSELEMVRPLVERGIEPRLSLVRAQNAAQSAESDVARANAALGQAQAGLAEANANLARMQQDWREQAAGELAVAQAESDARRSTLPALEERLDRTVLRAPTAGQVNRVLVSTRGSPVAPGAPLIEIVSSQDNLLIEARVSPQDIGSVRIGQPAKIGITAYDPSVYGSLEGKVSTISPDSIVDEQSGEVFYLVRVVANVDALTGPGGQKLEIGPGMIADVSLLGDKRTVLQYLLSPITRLSERAFRE